MWLFLLMVILGIMFIKMFGGLMGVWSVLLGSVMLKWYLAVPEIFITKSVTFREIFNNSSIWIKITITTVITMWLVVMSLILNADFNGIWSNETLYVMFLLYAVNEVIIIFMMIKTKLYLKSLKWFNESVKFVNEKESGNEFWEKDEKNVGDGE